MPLPTRLLAPFSCPLLLLLCVPLWLPACVQTNVPKGDTGAADTDIDTDTVDTDDTDTGVPDTDTGGTTEECPGDSDCDGLTDVVEVELGTDPGDPDSDHDGLGDFEELLNDTDPLDPDTDDDGVDDSDDEEPGTSGIPDADGDGLNDQTEALFGTNPEDPDSDSDELTDLEEILGGTDPDEEDTDGDGVDDGDEVNEHGTDPLDADSDDDGLSDWTEIFEEGTDPTNPDTDGDEVDDATEVAAGSDPYDPSEVPGDGAGDVVRCTDPRRTSGAAIYNVARSQGLSTAEASALYTDWDGALGEGTECSCQVVLGDPTPTAMTGVSVWIPSRAHSGTEWESEPIPGAVVLEVPDTWSVDRSARFAVLNELDSTPDDAGTETEHWFAFDDIASNTDDEYDLFYETPFDVSGMYTIRVSYANTLHRAMEDCEALAGFGVLADSLHFRVDTPASAAARFKRPPAPPRPEPLACSPGAEGTSTFALANVGEGVRPLLVAGVPGFAGARMREVSVAAWNGADRLELRRPAGVVAVLTPEHPSALIGQHDLPLTHVGWKSGRSTRGSWRDPVVQVRHQCPAGPGALLAGDTTSVTWSALDTALRAATGGVGVDLWRSGLAQSNLPALRAFLELGDAAVGDPDHLVFEAPGGGRLDALLLSQTSLGSWTFHHRRAGLQLTGTLIQSGNDLRINLTQGMVRIGGVTMNLAPAQLLLLGGSTP